ncbi:UNVERIFIED_CONTAM: hypothetical protein BEN50_14405 [Euhalothece sp. KZN 001]
MPLTIHQDAIGNKYIGYAGDLTDIASGEDIFLNIENFLQSFSNIKTNTLSTNDNNSESSRIAWKTNGISLSGIVDHESFSDSFFSLMINPSQFYFWSSGVAFTVNAKDLSSGQYHIKSASNISASNSQKIRTKDKAIAVCNSTDLGLFYWDVGSSDIPENTTFLWVGEVKGNSNISAPQTRSGIFLYDNTTRESIGVKQPDITTKRIHLESEASANHLIDCGTDTGRLYLIEDDGAGGDGGTVGYCENLYLSKKAGLTIGGFVTLDGITDGGSEQGIVVGQWGDNAHLIMRVYDGVN